MANGKKSRGKEPSRIQYKLVKRDVLNKARKAKNMAAFRERKRVDGHTPRGTARALKRHPKKNISNISGGEMSSDTSIG